MSPRTGRPPKGDKTLNNDIKVRVDNNTLNELDLYCQAHGGTRADNIRLALENLLICASNCQDKKDAENKINICTQIAMEYIYAINSAKNIMIESTEDASAFFELYRKVDEANTCTCREVEAKIMKL